MTADAVRDVATGFLADLDRNDMDAVGSWFADGATWWVDTGRDRAAGVVGRDPGGERPWPLHGTMATAEKVPLLHGVPSRYPDGLRQRAWQAFADDRTAVVEVDGDGTHVDGHRYANRYAFVIDVADGAITAVREYLDTLHAADVFAGRGLDRRTEADVVVPPAPSATTDGGRAALDLVAAVSDGDLDAIADVFTDDATWWTDGGTDRSAGARTPATSPRHPFHGCIPIADKLTAMAGIGAAFPDGLVIHPVRLVEDGDHVAVEVVGDAVHRNGRRYQNRYVFVLDVVDGRIAALREYADTLHIADVFGVDVPV